MVGQRGRSGRPRTARVSAQTDGVPQPPRKLSSLAQQHFDWLCERLGTANRGSVWRRIDGATLATLAELLESEQRLSAALVEDPLDEKLLRLRVQFADRIYKFSGIVGLTPRDRERLPAASDEEPEDEWSC